jgi:hypothetical protein
MQRTVPVGVRAVTECRVATGGMRRTIGGRAKLTRSPLEGARPAVRTPGGTDPGGPGAMFDDDTLRLWELASHLVTVIGLPLAVFVVWREARAGRDNERKEIEQRDEETYLRLSEQYTEFVQSVLRYPELGLHPRLPSTFDLAPDQQARKLLFFEMLIALFERAYILLYEEALDPEGARRWQSWADYMEQWCGRDDFRDALPDLLAGEDPAFSRYILALRDRTAP